MTVRSSDFGGSPYKVGDLRPLPKDNRPKFFVEDGQEWLMSGSLRSNAGNAYADLLARASGYGVNFLAAADRLSAMAAPNVGATTPVFSRHTMYHNGTNYVLAPTPDDTSIGSQTYVWASSLAGAGTPVTINATNDGVTGHCQMASGVILFATTQVAVNAGVKRIAANGSALLNATTGPTAQAYAGVATDGTLAVAVARGLVSNGANGVQTSTDGAVWTARTGTSGAIGATTGMIGIHYAPHLAKFFKWGGGVGGVGTTVILATVDGFTDTVALAEVAAYTSKFVVGASAGYQASAASSPTATFIPVVRKSGSLPGWLKTTDGTAWVFTSPFLDATQRLPSALPTVLNIQYDAARARLVAWPANSANSGDYPSHYYSTDDGATWVAGPAFDDEDTTVVSLLGFDQVNGNDLVHVGKSGTPQRYVASYAGSKFGPQLSHVGLLSAYAPATGINYAVRIK